MPGRGDPEWDADHLQAARAATCERINEARDRAAFGGCMTPKGRVDTTEASKTNVSGAVVSAMLALQFSQPFAIDWTMADNSAVPHDAMQMIALGQAVSRHVATCHAIATGHKAAVRQMTIEQVEAFDVAAIAWVLP